MEWLKKHWEILAAIAVGIPIVYWLYQTYQTNQAQAAQAASDATANADALASAQQLADATAYGGYYSGGGGGGYSGSTIAPPVSTVVTPTSTNTAPVSSPASGGGFLSAADAIAALPVSQQNGDYSFSQNSSVANNPNPIYAPGSPQAIALGYSPDPNAAPAPSTASSAISTMLGSGGGNNDTAPVAVKVDQNSTLQVLNDNISNGTMPQHTNPFASPTTVELSSLGGHL